MGGGQGMRANELGANGNRVRLVLADDHSLFREGLRTLLRAEPGFDVVGEAANGEEAVRLVLALKPDVLLLDFVMPGMNGIEVLRELSTADTGGCRVMLLTAGLDRQQTLEALQLGARGVVPKESATPTLFKGIRAVMADQYWIGRESVSDLVRYLTQATRLKPARPSFGLTDRELQIVGAVAEGNGNKDIAERFSLSADTVKHHLTNIFDKTGVSSRVELAVFAIHHSLVNTDRV